MSLDGVLYKLQIQLHEIKPNDSHLVLNASRKWDQSTHPWRDLADVKLSSLLPTDVISQTRFSLENLPSSIVLPPAKTIFDYGSLRRLKSKIYPGSDKLNSMKSTLEGKDLSIYCVSVTTGKRKGAGTDANVFLSITGKLSICISKVISFASADDLGSKIQRMLVPRSRTLNPIDNVLTVVPYAPLA